RIEYIDVIAGAAVECVVAGPAGQRVVSSVAVECVAARSALKRVGEAGAVERVIAGAADDRQSTSQADRGAIYVYQRLNLVGGRAEILIDQLNLVAGDAVADQQVITRHIEGHIGRGEPGSELDDIGSAALADGIAAVARIE